MSIEEAENVKGNNGNFTDGEMINIIGGPSDGGRLPVKVVKIGDKVRAGCIAFVTTEFAKHRYVLSHRKRVWVYDKPAKLV